MLRHHLCTVRGDTSPDSVVRHRSLRCLSRPCGLLSYDTTNCYCYCCCCCRFTLYTPYPATVPKHHPLLGFLLEFFFLSQANCPFLALPPLPSVSFAVKPHVCCMWQIHPSMMMYWVVFPFIWLIYLCTLPTVPDWLARNTVPYCCAFD